MDQEQLQETGRSIYRRTDGATGATNGTRRRNRFRRERNSGWKNRSAKSCGHRGRGYPGNDSGHIDRANEKCEALNLRAISVMGEAARQRTRVITIVLDLVGVFTLFEATYLKIGV